MDSYHDGPRDQFRGAIRIAEISHKETRSGQLAHVSQLSNEERAKAVTGVEHH